MGNMMIIELVLRKMLQEPPIFDGENHAFLQIPPYSSFQ